MTDDETHEEFDYPTAEEEEAEEQLDEEDIRYLKAQAIWDEQGKGGL